MLVHKKGGIEPAGRCKVASMDSNTLKVFECC